MRIREHPDDGPYVEGLTKATLTDVKTLRTVIGKSIKNSEHVHNLNDSKRFNEGRKINLSLSCLSTVIGKLAISPSYKHYNETLNTLRYAQQAKLIKNAPKVNEDSCTTYIKQLLNEISTLKQRLYEKDYCTVGRVSQ
uniref:Kinesin-like protein KIF3C n=1 Tax=Schistosoma haematobium TaxID=6185 RepID=A0A095A4X5_SCHHA